MKDKLFRRANTHSLWRNRSSSSVCAEVKNGRCRAHETGIQRAFDNLDPAASARR